MSLTRYFSGLQARFDSLALRPPAAAPDETTTLQRDASTAAALQAWCQQGAGPGGSGWFSPGGRPALGQRLAVAALRGAPGASTHAPSTQLAAWADALARQLDGGSRLDALPGRAAGLLWRLQTKRHDAMWWRQRQAADPWDAGWAVVTPPALRRLQGAWMPRRATLILAEAGEIDALRPVLAALWQRQDDFHHPLRWLWVGGAADVPAQQGLAVARFQLT